MRIATWNVNSLKARLPRVEEWLGEVEPDILCMQETKLDDAAFPAMTFQSMGYEAVHHGEGRWNGVAILSRVGIDDVVDGFGDDDPPDGEARLVWATCGGVRVGSAYIPNGREVGHDHYRYKLAWLARLRTVLDRQAGGDGADLVVCGDFNVAPADEDVWNVAAFEGATHVSDAERAALAELESWGLHDVFRERQPQPGLFSWWDYRAGSFHKRQGMRIDLVLASGPLASRAAYAVVDRNARKGKGPSDHAPVIVDFRAPVDGR
ncbi:MAG TPA: exodeoxyribonuclease III [Acidimicrobiales bacterium]|jgi:exodeoxyribonuclease-3|nr:exodeoxyribonuclease III [Acidimicrobiales bacterium]